MATLINVKENRRHYQEWTRATFGTGIVRRQTKLKSQQRELKRWATRIPSKKRGWTQVLAKG